MVEENKQPAQTTTEASPAEASTKPTNQPKTANDEKWLNVLAYASIGFILPLILKPQSKSCQFHVKQGVGMFFVSIVVLFILAIPSTIFSMLGTLLFLGYFGVTILAMFQASQGNDWKIPVLGDITSKLDISKMAGGMVTTTPPTTVEAPAEAKPKQPEAAPAVETKAVEAPTEAPEVETPQPVAATTVEAAPAETPAEEPKEEEKA